MDNCERQQKSAFVDIFFIVNYKGCVWRNEIRFFVIGHTHEYIDGCFGYLSNKLKEQNNYVLVDLMRVFMVSQEWPFIL